MNSKQNEILQSLEYCERQRIEPKQKRVFSVETEHGDVVTCKHESEINIVPKGHKAELNRVSFTNTSESSREGESSDAEVQPNVRDLMKNMSRKRIEISSKGKYVIHNLVFCYQFNVICSMKNVFMGCIVRPKFSLTWVARHQPQVDRCCHTCYNIVNKSHTFVQTLQYSLLSTQT